MEGDAYPYQGFPHVDYLEDRRDDADGGGGGAGRGKERERRANEKRRKEQKRGVYRDEVTPRRRERGQPALAARASRRRCGTTRRRAVGRGGASGAASPSFLLFEFIILILCPQRAAAWPAS